MTTILNFLKAFFPAIESAQERDEAYLAGSVDIYDLERRMREIDERGRATPSPIAFAPHTR